MTSPENFSERSGPPPQLNDAVRRQQSDRDTTQEIGRLFAAGDINAAFETMAIEYADVVRFYCHKMLGGYGEVAYSTSEEVAQEVFLSAFKQLERFDFSRLILPWLFRIAYNTCCGVLRKQGGRFFNTGINSHNNNITEEQSLVQKYENRQFINFALEALSDDERSIILQTVEGLKASDIAENLGITASGVRTKRRRAFEKMRKRVENE